MLEIRNIHKSFGSTPVLGGIDLDVKQGDVIAIIGPSGSGKTTLPALPELSGARRRGHDGL